MKCRSTADNPMTMPAPYMAIPKDMRRERHGDGSGSPVEECKRGNIWRLFEKAASSLQQDCPHTAAIGLVSAKPFLFFMLLQRILSGDLKQSRKKKLYSGGLSIQGAALRGLEKLSFGSNLKCSPVHLVRGISWIKLIL